MEEFYKIGDLVSFQWYKIHLTGILVKDLGMGLDYPYREVDPNKETEQSQTMRGKHYARFFIIYDMNECREYKIASDLIDEVLVKV